MQKKLKKVHRQSNVLTIMFIPESSSKTKSIKIPRWFLHVVVGILCTFAIVVVVANVNAARSQQMVHTMDSELQESSRMNELLELEKDELEEQKDKIEEEIVIRKKEYEDKLKELENIADAVEKKIKELDKTKEEIYNKLSEKEGSPVSQNPASFDLVLPYTFSANASYNDIQFLETLSKISAVEQKLLVKQAEYDKLNKDTDKVVAFLAHYPSGWPVYGNVTSEVGSRGNPFGGTGSEYHSGLDIKVNTGTPVKATAGGEIFFSGVQNGYGYLVIIDHGNGYETYYAHNSQLLLNKGDTVKRGDIIAKSGSTGRSTGPHVHYEVRYKGEILNPRDFVE